MGLIGEARWPLEDTRASVVEAPCRARDVVRRADRLWERYPEARLRDVEGLVKLVDRAEIEAHDWSPTPGRHVDIVPEEEDEDFDFEEALRAFHVKLENINDHAVRQATKFDRIFGELGT